MPKRDECHRTTFATITRMQRRGVPVDAVTVKQELSTAGVFKESSVSPVVYLAETGRAVTTIAHFNHFADQVAEASRKRTIRSEIGDIPGIGPERQRVLLRRFGSVRGLREATREEIARIPGFSQALASRVLTYLGR